MRQAGILLPIFSLPGRYGIGTFGREALKFVDLLAESGNRFWQLLPMGPTGFGDSPYQSFSAFAGNPYFIDLETLISRGLLTEEELSAEDFGSDPEKVDYGKLYLAKDHALRTAYRHFLEKEGEEKSEALLQGLRKETLDYCEFMAIKKAQDGKSWTLWEKELREREDSAMERARRELLPEISYQAFVQGIFEEQWRELKHYAGLRGIQMIGDIPIYCAMDSADVWARRELFQFSDGGDPESVAGVPPDSFSATGQLWGNPLYRWEKHEESRFEWWLSRMDYCLSLYDVLRVDHFRGFEAYYSVPFGAKTAEQGEWLPGPGMALFDAMYRHFGKRELPIIAEDLGVITDEVRSLMKETGFPGMKVLQFAFGSDADNCYLPHNFETRNCICYTGTHDNDTLSHWFETLPDGVRGYIFQYCSRSEAERELMPELLIKLAMSSIADTVVIPAADYLNLSGEARINEPGTTGGNWVWRMPENSFSEEKKLSIARILGTYGRYRQAGAKPEVKEEAKEDSEEEGLKNSADPQK